MLATVDRCLEDGSGATAVEYGRIARLRRSPWIGALGAADTSGAEVFSMVSSALAAAGLSPAP